MKKKVNLSFDDLEDDNVCLGDQLLLQSLKNNELEQNNEDNDDLDEDLKQPLKKLKKKIMKMKMKK